MYNALTRETWTDERIERLRKLASDGLSGSQIANELGGVTRSGVCGKAARLGISLGNNQSATVRRQPAAQVAPRRSQRVSFNPPLPKRVQRPDLRPKKGGRFSMLSGDVRISDGVGALPEEPLPELLDIPFAQRKTLIQLTEHTCRWPVGHPGSGDFFFCGGDVALDRPYCAFHSRIAYEPRNERKDSQYFEFLARRA